MSSGVACPLVHVPPHPRISVHSFPNSLTGKLASKESPHSVIPSAFWQLHYWVLVSHSVREKVTGLVMQIPM